MDETPQNTEQSVPVPPSISFAFLKYLKIGLKLIIVIFFLYVVLKIISFLPPGITAHSVIQNINFSEFNIHDDHRNNSLAITEAALPSLPTIPIVEFGIGGDSDHLFSFIDNLLSLGLEIMPRMPSFSYTVKNGKFILGPDISCAALAKNNSIFINTWYDEIYPVAEYPQHYNYQRGDDVIEIVINNINQDGFLDATFNDQPLSLKPGQEFKFTTTYKSFVSKSSETWYLRNLNHAKVQCFPDFVTDAKIRNEKLRGAAKTELNERYCSQISVKEISTACYNDIYSKYIEQAINTKDSQTCEKIDPQKADHDMHSRCYQELAEATKDWSLCKYIPDTNRNSKNLCYMKTSTTETCSSISDIHEIDWCYNSHNMCELITQKGLSDRCYYSHIKEVWSRIGTQKAIKMCKELENPSSIQQEYSRKRCLEILKEAAANDPNAYLDFQE